MRARLAAIVLSLLFGAFVLVTTAGAAFASPSPDSFASAQTGESSAQPTGGAAPSSSSQEPAEEAAAPAPSTE